MKILLIILLIILLLPISVCAEGNGDDNNEDGKYGKGTWSSQNQGLRITLVTKEGETVSDSVDIVL